MKYVATGRRLVMKRKTRKYLKTVFYYTYVEMAKESNIYIPNFSQIIQYINTKIILTVRNAFCLYLEKVNML